MSMLYLLKGIILGLSIAAPVGPIGVLCIRRTLVHGKLIGFLSGLGAATADAIYGSIAAAGLTAITDFLLVQQLWLQTVGGLFLCYMGVQILRAKPAEKAAAAVGEGRLLAYVSTLLLTLTNPLTILTFLAIFAGFGLTQTGGDILFVFSLVAGIFTGSALWWFLLCFGVARLQPKLDPRSFVWVNRISGSIVVLFGAFSLLQAVALK